MKTIALVLVSILAASGAAGALAIGTQQAPAASAAYPSCDGGILKDTKDCAFWAVRCIGDALGGNPCTGAAESEASGGVVEYAQCMVERAKAALKGQPSLPCYLWAEATAEESAGPKESVQCVYTQVKGRLEGTTPQPCVVEPGAAVASAESSGDVVEYAECMADGAMAALKGRPSLPCYL